MAIMHTPTLYLMMGYPGAGKTTVAALIAELTGATHIWTDRVRVNEFQGPHYTDEENQALYAELNAKAARMLKGGKSVVFDATFNLRKDREKLCNIARENGADCLTVFVQTPLSVAKDRATHNAKSQPTRLLGDMPPDLFERIANHLEPPTDQERFVTIHGKGVTSEVVRDALEQQRAARG